MVRSRRRGTAIAVIAQAVMARSLSLLSALVAVTFSSCGGGHVVHRPQAEPAPKAVSVATAQREEIDVLFRAPGTIRGRNTAQITSKTVAHVRDVAVRAGDVVAEGQALATLEANDVEASVRHAEAGLAESLAGHAAATSALSGARADAAVAKANRDRASALLARGATTQQDFDQVDARARAAAAQEEAARARVVAARSAIEGARAMVAEARANLGYTHIAAPFAGRVIERRVDPGSLASPGTTLLVLEQGGALRVEAPVDELRGASIVIGDSAIVEFEAPRGPVRATVGEIVPSIDVASRAFLVKVDLPDDLPDLRPGMFVRVAFRVGRRSPLVIPPGAITSSGALDRVFVIDGNHARLRIVTLGEPSFPRETAREESPPWIEVLSGLDQGERVVSSVPIDLRDGGPVTFSDVGTPGAPAP